MKKSKNQKMKSKLLSMILAIAIMVGTIGLVPGKSVNASEADKMITINTIKTISAGDSNLYYEYDFVLDVPSTGYLQFNNVEGVHSVKIFDENKELNNGKILVRAGRYYPRIKKKDSEVAKFSYTFKPVDESYPETNDKNNDAMGTAASLSVVNGKLLQGVFCENDHVDWFKFKIKKSSMVNIYFKRKAIGAFDYSLISSDGNVIFKDDIKSTWDPSDEVWYTRTLEPGVYYIRILGNVATWGDIEGLYNFSVKATEYSAAAKCVVSKAPKVKAKKGGKITVSWKKYSLAKGYQIQVSSRKNFKGATTKTLNENNKSITFKLKKALRGKKVYVRVRSYNITPDDEKVFSKWSKVKTIKTKK